ncbi:MAG: NRDE family protein [Methanobacteriota archaeon]|nr:MAG: NRDE family protein [Euryarchaeota archaeon]
MCTLIGLHRAVPGYDLVIGMNRDEDRLRPAEPPQLLPGPPPLVAPRDARAGGTWLGVNRPGLFAALSNRRGKAYLELPDASMAKDERQYLALVEYRNAVQDLAGDPSLKEVASEYKAVLAENWKGGPQGLTHEGLFGERGGGREGRDDPLPGGGREVPERREGGPLARGDPPSPWRDGLRRALRPLPRRRDGVLHDPRAP